MTDYLLRGILIGLLFGLPVGAVGAMTVQRTWTDGVRAGLFTGLGSSVADCFYASVGVFGLAFISDFLLKYQTMISIIGGSFILFMGIQLLCKRNDTEIVQKAEAVRLTKMFISSFIVGITNPAAILTFIFAFSYFRVSGSAGFVYGVLLVCGVFIGTYIWWSALSIVTAIIKKKSAKFNFRHIDRIFGSILCMFGVVVFIRLLLQ